MKRDCTPMCVSQYQCKWPETAEMAQLMHKWAETRYCNYAGLWLTSRLKSSALDQHGNVHVNAFTDSIRETSEVWPQAPPPHTLTVYYTTSLLYRTTGRFWENIILKKLIKKLNINNYDSVYCLYLKICCNVSSFLHFLPHQSSPLSPIKPQLTKMLVGHTQVLKNFFRFVKLKTSCFFWGGGDFRQFSWHM